MTRAFDTLINFISLIALSLTAVRKKLINYCEENRIIYWKWFLGILSRFDMVDIYPWQPLKCINLLFHIKYNYLWQMLD